MTAVPGTEPNNVVSGSWEDVLSHAEPAALAMYRLYGGSYGDAFQASTAISLKRIADALEAANVESAIDDITEAVSRIAEAVEYTIGERESGPSRLLSALYAISNQ